MTTRTVAINYVVRGANAATAQMSGMAAASGRVAAGTAAAATGTAKAGPQREPQRRKWLLREPGCAGLLLAQGC